MVADSSIDTNDEAALNYAYRHESDADVRERILLIRRVRVDGKYIEDVAGEELHRCRAWAYKWMKRFDAYGLDGLKSRPPILAAGLQKYQKMLCFR